MLFRPLNKILVFAVISVGLSIALTALSGEPPVHPAATTAPSVATSSPVETNTAYAGWKKQTISALASKFVPEWEFNLSYEADEEGDGTHVHLMPRGEPGLFDGEIDLWFSLDEKLVKMKGDYLEQPEKEYVPGRDIRIADPIVIPVERMPNPLDMRVIDVALREAKSSLNQGQEYNTDFYYGLRGPDNRQGIYVGFSPAEKGTAPKVNVSFDIKVEVEE